VIVGDRVLYYPDEGRLVRPFRGTVVKLWSAYDRKRRATVEWDDEDEDDDAGDGRVSVMFVRQLVPLSIVDRLAELA
jgi:hypothetical protein